MNRKVLALLLLLAVPLNADIDFDGSINEFVDFGNPSALQITGSFTIMAWFYWRGHVLGQGRGITKLGAVGATERGYELGIDDWTANGELACYISSDGSAIAGRYNSAAFPRNRWTHVACTYNAPAADIIIYQDGVRVDNSTYNTVPTSIFNTATTFRVGARGGTATLGTFNGRITDVRVYNIKLSTQTIESIALSRSRIRPSADGLVGYWPMDEGFDLQAASGTVVVDRSTSTNNGFAHGISTYTASEWINYP